MAKITASVYTSHVPAVGAAFDLGKADQPYWKLVFDGYETSKQWMKANTPDVVYIPPGWICIDEFFDSGNVCDAMCGTLDFDCIQPPIVV